MEMDSVLSCHIVLVARVREIIHLHIVLHAFAYETEAVFPYDYRVDCALADEKLAFEVLGLVDEACLRLSLRIGVWMVHIALAVHHFVPLPVDHRTAGNAYLEYVRIIGNQ